MKLALLALGAAAVAFGAAPADARHHGYRHHGRACAHWRHGHCVRWINHGYMVSMARHGGYDVGYSFGPDYEYTEFSALPLPIVTRYHLSENERYVVRNGSVYVVSPRTYRVIRVVREH